MKQKLSKAYRIKTVINQKLQSEQTGLNKFNLPFIKSNQSKITSNYRQLGYKLTYYKNIKLISTDFNKESQLTNQRSAMLNIVTQNKRSFSHKNSIFSGLNISTKNWCLYDINNNKFMGFRYQYARQVASLTKIMTTFISIQFLQKQKICLNSIIKVTSTAAALCGTTAQLIQGMELSFKDLLYGTMLPSGNDAAYSLAEYIGWMMYEMKGRFSISKTSSFDLTKSNTIGYVNEFIKYMNLKCQQLNLANTRFSNPHGLQNAFNTSTAKDILELSLQASTNKCFNQIIKTQYYKCVIHLNDHQTKNLIWQNTNKLLWRGWSGTKTGYTFTAGGCLSSIKNNIVIVVLNCLSSQNRFTDTQNIYNWYCNNFQLKQHTTDIIQNVQNNDIQFLTDNQQQLTKSSSNKEQYSQQYKEQ